MSPEDASSLKVWELVANVGWLLLILGVVLEGIELCLKKTHDPLVEEKRKRLTRFGWILVVLGLGAEYLGEHRSKRIADREGARLNKEAGEARRIAGEANERAGRETTKRVELEKQLWETKLAVTNLNPLKQPISSVVAFVQFKTPHVNTIDRGRGFADSIGIADLRLGRSESVTTNRFAIRLVANKFIEWSASEFSLQFVMDPHSPRWNLKNEAAEEVFEWDAFWLSQVFLPLDTEILEGHGTVIINGLVRREFSIPAGKLRGNSAMWNTAKNAK